MNLIFENIYLLLDKEHVKRANTRYKSIIIKNKLLVSNLIKFSFVLYTSNYIRR